MHMADALISPAVGSAMTVVSAGAAAYSINQLRENSDDGKIPLIGVMGAFVFAAQMINFSIPGTGSSGHLGGGMLLSVILGPYAGFLAMVSILLIQALFFADGGILALGCNIFNLGFCTCFLAYPLIFKRMVKDGINESRIFKASMLSSIIGLQAGALCVVIETVLSGRTEIPFATFTGLMLPVHLAIGIVEGLITSAVVTYIWKAKPDIIENSLTGIYTDNKPATAVIGWLGAAVILTGGFLCWFASTHPDGLEWSLFRATGKEEIAAEGKVHRAASDLQAKTAIMPDYEFRKNNVPQNEKKTPQWPEVSGGRSTAGITGSLLTLILVILAGFGIKLIKRKTESS